MNQAAIAIRSANVSDADAISILLQELGYSLGVAAVTRNLARLSESPSDTVLVAEIASNIAGVISFHIIPLFHVAGSLGRITSLVVGAQWQRQGVGSKLVRAAEEYGRERGCLRIEVTSGDRRAGAHEFYQRLGYGEDERRFIKRLVLED